MALTKAQIKQASAAASYIQPETEQEPAQEQETEQPIKEKRKTISLYILPSVYKQIKALAHYRQTSAGKLINEILSDYMTEHAEELDMFEKFYAQMERINKGFKDKK